MAVNLDSYTKFSDYIRDKFRTSTGHIQAHDKTTNLTARRIDVANAYTEAVADRMYRRIHDEGVPVTDAVNDAVRCFNARHSKVSVAPAASGYVNRGINRAGDAYSANAGNMFSGTPEGIEAALKAAGVRATNTVLWASGRESEMLKFPTAGENGYTEKHRGLRNQYALVPGEDGPQNGDQQYLAWDTGDPLSQDGHVLKSLSDTEGGTWVLAHIEELLADERGEAEAATAGPDIGNNVRYADEPVDDADFGDDEDTGDFGE